MSGPVQTIQASEAAYADDEARRGVSSGAAAWSAALAAQNSADSAAVDAADAAAGKLDSPNAVGNLTAATSTVLDGEGQQAAQAVLTWTAPGANTDDSPIVDGSRFEIQFHRVDETSWQVTAVSWDTLALTIAGLPVGVPHEVRVRAIDTWGNQSVWVNLAGVVSDIDMVPPSTPDPVVMAVGSPLNVLVTHKLGTGGVDFTLEDDLSALEVHVGTTVGFVVSTSTKAGEIQANAGTMAAGTVAVGAFPVPATVGDVDRWVRVVAVDRVGNASGPSASVAVTVGLIDNENVVSLVADKIAAGSITASLSISSGTLYSGSVPGVPLGTAGETGVYIDTDGIHLYDAGALQVFLAASGASASLFNGELIGAGIEAGNITAGTIDAARVGVGTIGARELAPGGVPSVALAADLQSDNYDGTGAGDGTQGWHIARDTGDAEFNDVNVRGGLESRELTDPNGDRYGLRTVTHKGGLRFDRIWLDAVGFDPEDETQWYRVGGVEAAERFRGGVGGMLLGDQGVYQLFIGATGAAAIDFRKGFTYQGGYTPYGGSYQEPFYRVGMNCIEAWGLVNSSVWTTSNKVFATLPTDFHPDASNVYTVHSANGPVRMDVKSSGGMEIRDNPGSYLTLGVSWPLPDSLEPFGISIYP